MKFTLLFIMALMLGSLIQANGLGYKPMKPNPGLDQAMLEAIKAEDTGAAIKLLRQGANPNTKDNHSAEHLTALMWAASDGNAEVTLALLKHGAIP